MSKRAPKRVRKTAADPDLYAGVHSTNPYHRIKKWNGLTFEDTTLKALGLRIQLGHSHDQSRCSNPIPTRDDFCAIHIDGRHLVAVDYCGCDNAARAGTVAQQLLRYDLWPATESEPNTAFTFQLLEHYHIHSLEGNATLFHYYNALECMTDNTGTGRVQDRYKAFMRVVAQWRHLKRLKRCGRGHHPSGVMGTQPGELTVRCPACPHPGINIPDNWDTVSDDLKYMYMVTIAMDACFRLKRRAVSNEDKDPILGSGWGYFVEDTGYKEVLHEYGAQEEMSTCTGLSAVDHANTKFSRGYAATGVGGMMCARHELWLALGIGDVQKGEKYINMDYIFVCAIRRYLLLHKLVSYDIACQWSVGLLERIARFPAHLRIEIPQGSIAYAIPKLHFGAHRREGHSPYSLNYRIGAARTDGEAIERGWWWIQPAANATKQMGPGQRQGLLEDLFGFSNWRKIVKMPWTMRDKLRKALKAYREQLEDFEELTASLTNEHNVTQWRTEVVAWEADPFNRDDPYVTVSQGPTQGETLRTLAEEEQRASAVPGFIALHDVSVVGFVSMGLELEETKARLREDAKKATGSKVAGLFERRTALRRKLQKFREIQGIYMPRAITMLSEDPACRLDVELVEEVRLGLPSEISASRRDIACSSHLQDVEARLREAQCRDALQSLRNQLHTLDHLYRYKKTHVRHQGANTRARQEISTENIRKDRATQQYRHAHRAKLALSGGGAWEHELRLLQDSDIRGIQEDDPSSAASRKRARSEKDTGPSEGRRLISWIWHASDLNGSEEMLDSLRVEWLKARARTNRWGEEVKLVPEEMRRVLETHSHDELEWKDRAQSCAGADAAFQEGLVAYAHKQAAIRKKMRATFVGVCLAEVQAAKGDSWVVEKEWQVTDSDAPTLPVDALDDEDELYEFDPDDLDL